MLIVDDVVIVSRCHDWRSAVYPAVLAGYEEDGGGKRMIVSNVGWAYGGPTGEGVCVIAPARIPV